MRQLGITLLGSLGVLCIAVAPADCVDSSYSLTPTGGRLVIEDCEGTVSLGKLEAIFPDRQRGWVEAQPDVPLWTVTLVDAQRNSHAVTALDGQGAVRRASRRQVKMEWTGVEPGDIRVVVTVSVRGADLEWDFQVEVGESEYKLWDILFPEIGPIALHGEVHWVAPYGWGILRSDLLSRHDEKTYPGAAQAMPFIAVSDGETGLYLGAHDRAGYAMRFVYGRRASQECVSLGIRHDVEGMRRVDRYRLPYSVVVTPYQGDWYEAARLYRQAAMKTPWGSIPPLTERRDIPKWLLETDLWYVGSCHNEATADQVLAFAEYFHVPTSAHIYTWHEIPFDDHYPEYFPAKPGFKAAVQRVQQAGIAVMPYINGRLWDPATESWRAKKAGESCALDERGEPYVEVYGSKVPLSPMCPFTDLWQETVVNLVDRLLHEVGVRAVYIDQISAAAAKRCFATNHGHTEGGGTYWIQGYRDLLKKCRDRLPSHTALTTEENADPWNDLLHAWLMVNTPETSGRIVPLYPAVYGGRAISFGFQYIHGSDLLYRYPFRLKMAQAFVFGSQLGWVGPEILDEKHTREAEFLKRLCQARRGARDALQFGELLAPVGLEHGGTVSWTTGNGKENTRHTGPAVLATAWLTPDGKRKIAFVSVADEDHTVRLTLDRRHLGRVVNDVVTLRKVDGGSVTRLHQEARGRWSGLLTVPACSAFVAEIQ